MPGTRQTLSVFIYRGFTGGSDRKEAARGVGDLGVLGFFYFSLILFLLLYQLFSSLRQALCDATFSQSYALMLTLPWTWLKRL